MTFDLLSSVILTASATVVVATFVALFGSSLTQRILIGTGMGLWFLGVLFAARLERSALCSSVQEY
jgi:hypothetical protein